MASLDDELFQDAEDDARTVTYIREQLPQELKERFSEELLYYFLDLIVEYYATSGVLDATPDKNGFVDINLAEMAAALAQKAQKEKMGTFDPDDLVYIIEAEMDFNEQG